MSKMKFILITLSIVIVAAIITGGVIFLSPISTEAAMQGTSSPTVTVAAGGSITVTPTGMAYGSKAAGSHTAYGDDSGHTVRLQVDTNTTTWNVKVSKDQDLTKSGGATIPSSGFIYSSVYVSGTPSSLNLYSSTQFGTVGSPSSVVDPNPAAAATTLLIDVRYDLTIPPTQATGAYSATHTYTLTAS